MKQWLKICTLSIMCWQKAGAQAIDNLQAYKYINDDRYIRLNYENDFFTATDEYYTQGINPEVVSPAMRHNPLTRLPPIPRHWQTQYGLGIQIAFGF